MAYLTKYRFNHGRFSALFVGFVVLVLGGVAGAQAPGAMDFAPEKVEKSRPPSAIMRNAVKLYADGEYRQATVLLQKVINGTSGDDTVQRQRATFWMGKSLYHLGLFGASLSYFDQVVQAGESHRYFSATLKWLASVAQKLPDMSTVLEKIGKYDQSELTQPALTTVKSELSYLLGRFYYSKGDFKRALQLFSDVLKEDPVYVRAQFLTGVTFVRLLKAKPAAAAFREVLRVAETASDTPRIEEFKELAQLSLARVFYSTRQFKLSAKYYEGISAHSPRWLDARFESAWAYFMRGNFSKALGNIHALNSPYFEGYFFPESLILKAVIYWKNCLYRESDLALKEFSSRYLPLKSEIDTLLKKFSDSADLYSYIVKVQERKAGLKERTRKLVLSVLTDRQTERSFAHVAALTREVKSVEKSDKKWADSAIAADLFQDLTLQVSLAQNAAGHLAHRRLKRLSTEINELRKQALKIEYEVIQGRKNRLQASLRKEQVSRATSSSKRSKIVRDDEHWLWPFTGEYWRDELAYYRFRIDSQCVR